MATVVHGGRLEQMHLLKHCGSWASRKVEGQVENKKYETLKPNIFIELLFSLNLIGWVMGRPILRCLTAQVSNGSLVATAASFRWLQEAL